MSSKLNGTRRAAWILAIGILFITGAWLRFHDLDEIELFVDEGGHLLIPVDDDVRRVINPLAEGKPGMLWFFRPAHMFARDPLIAGRVMIGVCGLLSSAAIGATLLLLFGRTAAVIGSALWLLLPFTVFHERLALFDPLIATLIASGIAVVAYGNQPEKSSKQALIWTLLGSLLAGTAVLQKLSALTATPWLLFVLVAVQRRYGRTIGSRLVAAIAAFMLPGLLLWIAAPGLGSRILKAEAATAPLNYFPFVLWHAGYGGWPLLVLIFYAAFLVWRRKQRVIAWFGCAALLSLVVSSIVYRHQAYARYMHPDHVPLVIFLGAAVGSGPRRLGLALSAAACLRWLYSDLQIISNPTTAPLPPGEIEQYVTGFWSGHGSSQMVDFVEQHAPSVIFVHRYSRPGSYAFLLAARRNPSLIVVPLSIEIPGALEVARAATAQRRNPSAVYLLAEGGPALELSLLTAAGIPHRIVLENIKHGRVGALILECEFTRGL